MPNPKLADHPALSCTVTGGTDNPPRARSHDPIASDTAFKMRLMRMGYDEIAARVISGYDQMDSQEQQRQRTLLIGRVKHRAEKQGVSLVSGGPCPKHRMAYLSKALQQRLRQQNPDWNKICQSVLPGYGQMSHEEQKRARARLVAKTCERARVDHIEFPNQVRRRTETAFQLWRLGASWEEIANRALRGYRNKPADQQRRAMNNVTAAVRQCRYAHREAVASAFALSQQDMDWDEIALNLLPGYDSVPREQQRVALDRLKKRVQKYAAALPAPSST